MKPRDIKLRRKTQCLSLDYGSEQFDLDAEYLRVFSPSAEVKGHGVGQETLQVGKKYVSMTDVQAQGNYAIKIVFDDGHDSGIYTWEYLYDLGKNRATHWQVYCDTLHRAGKSRDPNTSAVKLITPE